MWINFQSILGAGRNWESKPNILTPASNSTCKCVQLFFSKSPLIAATVQCTDFSKTPCHWSTMLFRSLCVQKDNFSTFFIKSVKGIVSRDWGGLQTILMDRLEVFNFSASSYFLSSSSFSYRIFKSGYLSGASFQHISSNVNAELYTIQLYSRYLYPLLFEPDSWDPVHLCLTHMYFFCQSIPLKETDVVTWTTVILLSCVTIDLQFMFQNLHLQNLKL